MAGMDQVPGAAAGQLQVDADPQFEAKERRVQRVGPIALWVVLAAGLLGVLGPGLLSQTTASEPPLMIRYSSVGHAEAEEALEIDVANAGKAPVVLRLGGAWLRNSGIRDIVPQPEMSTAGQDALEFVFNPPPQPSPALHVEVHYRSRSIGIHSGTIAAEGVSIDFMQVVLP